MNISSLNLFPPNPLANLLPADGIVNYYGPVMPAEEACRYHDALLNRIPWKNDEVVIFGKHIVTARQVAWFGDREFSYAYSGSVKKALLWTAELLELKALAERLSGESFNSCLLNLYHHGGEGMGWHSDDEKAIVKNSAIASLSFGAGRKFCFKHKRTPETASLILENGSLLVMKGPTQAHWLHSLPKSKNVADSRINLTFRTIVP